MVKSGSRRTGAMMVVTGFLVVDARLALAQEQTQEGIQEVVVTAERRTENLQTTPIAITALTAEDLSKAGVNDFAGVAQQSTSINFTPYPSSSNTLILYMRGQGVADANQITQDGSVGLCTRTGSTSRVLRRRPSTSPTWSAWKCCAARRALCTDATPPVAPSTSSARSPPANWT